MAEKKGLKEFMEDLVKDNNLAEKFKDVVDPDKVAELAEEEGYYFTAQEYEDLAMAAVNGGFDFKKFFRKVEQGINSAPEIYKQGKDMVNGAIDFGKRTINDFKN